MMKTAWLGDHKKKAIFLAAISVWALSFLFLLAVDYFSLKRFPGSWKVDYSTPASANPKKAKNLMDTGYNRSYLASGSYLALKPGEYEITFALDSRENNAGAYAFQIAAESELILDETITVSRFPSAATFTLTLQRAQTIEPRVRHHDGRLPNMKSSIQIQALAIRTDWTGIWKQSLLFAFFGFLLSLAIGQALIDSPHWRRSIAYFLFLAGVFLFMQRIWITEDAFISLRCVDNFLAGYGPVFNPGERVEAFTHTLWFYVLVLFRWTGLGPKAASLLPGLIFSILALYLVFFKIQWSHQPLSSPLSWGGAILIGMSSFLDFGTSGLETGLTYFLLALMAYGTIKEYWSRRPWLMGLILSLLVLNRPDFVVFLGFWLAVYAWMFFSRRVSLRSVFSFLIVPVFLVGGYQLFRMGYYAALFPNPYYAKSGSSSYYSQGLTYLLDFLKGSFLGGILIICLAWIILKKRMPAGEYVQRWLILLPGILHGFFVIRGGGDFMHGRFLLPMAVLAAISCSDFMHDFVRTRKVARIFSVIILFSLFIVSLMVVPVQKKAVARTVNKIADERFLYLDLYANNLTRDWQSQGIIMRELSRRTQLPISYCYGNIGYFGYYAGPAVHVLDYLGLTDPIVARMRTGPRSRPGHEKRAPFAYLVYRGMTFQETPFSEWNRAAATPYGPLWDLSPRALQQFSFFLPMDFKANLDGWVQEQLSRQYMNGITEPQADFLFFLKRFWYPFAPAAGRDRFDLLDQRYPIAAMSPLAKWIEANRPLMEAFLKRIRLPLTRQRFLENIGHSLPLAGIAFTSAPGRWRPRQWLTPNGQAN